MFGIFDNSGKKLMTLGKLVYFLGVAAAVVLVAVGLYEMVMTRNVPMRQVGGEFLKSYFVWAVAAYVGSLVSGLVLHAIGASADAVQKSK